MIVYHYMRKPHPGYPLALHRGNWENGNKISPSASGKTQGYLAKTQSHRENIGNLAALVINSLILVKVKVISIFAAKIFNLFLSWINLPSQFCVCTSNSHKLRKLAQGKFAVGQGKHRVLKMQFEGVPWLSNNMNKKQMHLGFTEVIASTNKN